MKRKGDERGEEGEDHDENEVEEELKKKEHEGNERRK